MRPSVRIVVASTPEDYAAFAALVGEYVAWSRTRYRHDVAFIEQVFGHQSLARELEGLSVSYGPPNGRTLLAIGDGEVRGCGAWRRLAHDACEMKRLFVPARFGGHGIGRGLCEALVTDARAEGYGWMRLDTGRAFTEAIAMYRSIGFRDRAPYHAYPATVMPEMLFMELPLNDEARD